MHSITCFIQAFDPTTDTCSIELIGIGIIDAWIDGVAIAPTVDRAFIVGGMPGVVTMPDINRPCDATLIQVIPPGTPVSYDPDQIVTYTGSLSIPTDITGAGCENVVFPEAYSTPPLVSASAAHPASVTISTITETGFTACVTGGKVSSKHSVSYSAKSSKTSTATKNKALTVDHNEVEVGTHYILDFKDGDVVWTVTSHDSPARNQVEATLSPDFIATLPGGGGAAAELALAVESSAQGQFTTTGNWLGAQNPGATAPPFTGATPGGGINILDGFLDLSTVDYDPDSIFDPTTSTVTIPAGKGGWYRIEFLTQLSFDPRNSDHTNDLAYFAEFYDTAGGDNAGAQISEEYIWGGYIGAPLPSAGTDETSLDYGRAFHLNDGDTFQMQISCGCSAGNLIVHESHMALYRVSTGSGGSGSGGPSATLLCRLGGANVNLPNYQDLAGREGITGGSTFALSDSGGGPHNDTITISTTPTGDAWDAEVVFDLEVHLYSTIGQTATVAVIKNGSLWDSRDYVIPDHLDIYPHFLMVVDVRDTDVLHLAVTYSPTDASLRTFDSSGSSGLQGVITGYPQSGA